jgi:hypothetical protein
LLRSPPDRRMVAEPWRSQGAGTRRCKRRAPTCHTHRIWPARMTDTIPITPKSKPPPRHRARGIKPTTKAMQKAFWVEVAPRFRYTRKVLHIAEQDAAAAMRMSLKTYRRWETGENHAENRRGVFNFAKTYGTTFDWLLWGVGDAPRPKLRVV